MFGIIENISKFLKYSMNNLGEFAYYDIRDPINKVKLNNILTDGRSTLNLIL